MESDETFREYRQLRARFRQRLEQIRSQTDALLIGLESQLASSVTAAQLSSLGRELEVVFQDYLRQITTFTDYIRKIDQTNRRAAMAEKRPSPQRNQAEIQELSQELSTQLRLDRVDGAIKELLDFIADADFFAANASVGRKRRLRTLQNAIEKALQK